MTSAIICWSVCQRERKWNVLFLTINTFRALSSDQCELNKRLFVVYGWSYQTVWRTILASIYFCTLIANAKCINNSCVGYEWIKCGANKVISFALEYINSRIFSQNSWRSIVLVLVCTKVCSEYPVLLDQLILFTPWPLKRYSCYIDKPHFFFCKWRWLRCVDGGNPFELTRHQSFRLLLLFFIF